MRTLLVFLLGAAVATIFLTQKRVALIPEKKKTKPQLRIVSRTEQPESEKPKLH